MKVLIVGAGIAGPTLAYWLLRAGHEPTLVERAPELRRGGYLVDFWGAGFDVAERMGIVPELRRRGYVFTEARAVDRDGHRIASFEPSAVMGSTERYLSIARSDLAAVIYAALQDRVELILDDTISALDDDGGTRPRDVRKRRHPRLRSSGRCRRAALTGAPAGLRPARAVREVPGDRGGGLRRQGVSPSR